MPMDGTQYTVRTPKHMHRRTKPKTVRYQAYPELVRITTHWLSWNLSTETYKLEKHITPQIQNLPSVITSQSSRAAEGRENEICQN